MQDAGAVGRIELERAQIRQRRRQLETQRLVALADDAADHLLARFVQALAVVPVQLGRKQRLRRQRGIDRWQGHGLLAGALRTADDDELVGQGVGQRQQVARHRGRQGVEGDAEFRVGQGALHGIHLLGHPAVLAQEAHQRATGEEAQVRFVQQALGPVAELAGHQLGHQARVAGVGNRQQGAAVGGQQLAALVHDALRQAQVLQHVGADDDVVAARREQGGQFAGVEVGHLDPAIVGRGPPRFLAAEGQAVDRSGGRAVARGQEAADGATAAAEVEHAGAGRDVAGQDGQGSALTGVDVAFVDVRRGRGGGHAIGRTGNRWSAGTRTGSADATMRGFFSCAPRRPGPRPARLCMLSLALLAFALSLVATLWARRLFQRQAVRYDADAPQRFHFGDTPRMGGMGVLLGWALALAALPLLQAIGMAGNIDGARLQLPLWLLMLLPAFAGGVVEDLTQRLRVSWRMLLTLTSGLLAWVLLGVSVPHLGFAWVDGVWGAWPGLGIALAVLAVTGLPHAFNIIDGYNGLAGSVALVVCLALAHVALQVGDRELAAMVVTLAAAIAGFLVWNYPRGLIFAGDAGAYLWGLLIAVSSLLLVQRHPIVSPWFPMLLLIYPVWETVFSIYRKLARGDSPGLADALHLHQLVYRRLVRSVLHEDEAQSLLKRNNRTTPYLWGFMVLSVTPALLFWRYSEVLLAFCVLFAVCYVWAYLTLIRFKVPRVLQPPRE